MTIKEEGEGGAPTNNAGAGNIAGIGVGPKGEPGGRKAKLGNMLRRKRVRVAEEDESMFAGHKVFHVDPEYFHLCRMGKKKYHRYDKYVGSDEMGEKIRQYARSCTDPVILKDKTTGAMLFLRY